VPTGRFSFYCLLWGRREISALVRESIDGRTPLAKGRRAVLDQHMPELLQVLKRFCRGALVLPPPLGGSVQDACEAINQGWTAHGPAIRAAAVAAAKQSEPAVTPQPVVAAVAAPAAVLIGKLSASGNGK
jgi:hypothetical protein